ncbi:MAG: MFS transporter [Bacteroidales bacterium]|nr:MFS transporter [Bacteroidales bacterium]
MNKGLLALAIGTFALGIAEFSMMGILSDVAQELDISVVTAGHFISAYSVGVAVGAPALIFLRKMPLRRLLLLLAAVIAAGNTAAALSPGYHALLLSRFVSGLPHGAFFGAGAIVAARLAAEGRGASAVAVMVGGMTVANLVGVPGATWLSNALSWRYAFAVVALAGALAFVAIRLFVPVLKPLPDTGLTGQFAFLRKAAPWLVYAGVFFGQMSVYCWFSYINPIMIHVTGFAEQSMTWIMVIAGGGMVFGNLVSGKLADRYGAARVTAWIALLLVFVMAAIYFCAGNKILSLLLAFTATAGLFGIGGPLQYLITRYSKGGQMLGGAGIQIAFNVSNAIAAVLGGAVIHYGLGLASPALVGAPLAAVGAAALFILSKRYGDTD